MPIRDLFGARPEPEWKHPDAVVRAAAVRRLGDDELDVIRTLAREDPAPQVRRTALRRIRDVQVVAELMAQETDEAVREEAAGLLVAAANGDADPAGAEAALAALSDPRHLASVAKAAALEAVRQAALLRLGDRKLLGTVARDAQVAATGLAALE